MVCYTVMPQSDPISFSVDVIGDDGVHHSMLGFATEDAAEAWIEQDKRIEASQPGFANALPLI